MRRFALLATVLALGGLALAPVASAQYGPGVVPMNETAPSVSVQPGSEEMDPTGSVLISTAVLEGAVMGQPISGSLRIEEVRTRVADAGSGSIQGQFTLTDGFGSTLHGDLNGTFTVSGGSTNASGQLTVRGGTGPFTNASGSGSFSEVTSGQGMGSVTLSSSAISMSGMPGGAPANFNGLAPGYGAPAYVAPAYVQPSYAAPTYVAPQTLPGYYASPTYVDPNWGAYQAEAAGRTAAAQATQPQVIIVPVPESEWDPNGVFTNPPRSSATNRNPVR